MMVNLDLHNFLIFYFSAMFEAYNPRDILVFLKNLSLQLSRECPLANYYFLRCLSAVTRFYDVNQ